MRLDLDAQPLDRYHRLLAYVCRGGDDQHRTLPATNPHVHRIPRVASTSAAIGFKKATFMTQDADEATTRG